MRGTERVVKTIEERPGEKGGAFFNGKEGRDDSRTPFFNGKEGFCPLTGEPKGV